MTDERILGYALALRLPVLEDDGETVTETWETGDSVQELDFLKASLQADLDNEAVNRGDLSALDLHIVKLVEVEEFYI